MKKTEDFAKLFRAKDGRQVVIYVDLDDKQNHILKCVTSLRGAVASISVCFGEKQDEKLAYMALDKADQEFADCMVDQVKGVAGVSYDR